MITYVANIKQMNMIRDVIRFEKCHLLLTWVIFLSVIFVKYQ